MHACLLALVLKLWSILNASGSLASSSFGSNSLSDSSLFFSFLIPESVSSRPRILVKLERFSRFSVWLSKSEHILEMVRVFTLKHVCTRGLLVSFLKLWSILNASGS